jgi:hypothetical protein
MSRTVDPRRVARLQRRYLQQLGANKREIKQWRPYLTAQIGAESNFTQGIGSPAGARDIAQFMPGTAPSYGVTLGDGKIKDDIRGQIKYMLPLLRKYGVEGALRGYNAGPGAIQASKDFSETNAYVDRIFDSAGKYRGIVGPGRGGGGGMPQMPGGRPGNAQVVGGSTAGIPDPMDMAAVLEALRPPKQAAPSMPLPEPAVSGRNALAMPEMYQQLQTGGPPMQQDNLSVGDALGLLAQMGNDIPAVQGPGILTTPGTVGGQQTGGLGAPRGGGGSPLGGGSAKAIGGALDSWVDAIGLKPGSGQRSAAENAAVGGAQDSDHLAAPGRWARDYPTTAAAGGWKQYRKIARTLGITPAKNGFTEGTVKIGKHRYRVQVIFGEEHAHGDHVHVGIRRA